MSTDGTTAVFMPTHVPAPTSLAASQRDRIARFGGTRSVDCHCHILPGVDDGPKTLEESVQLCRALVADGLTDIIATPHQMGRYEGINQPADLRLVITMLQRELDGRGIGLTLHIGGEIRLDERIATLLANDRISTLADAGRQILLELQPSMPVSAGAVTSLLSDSGVQIVLAHPERYDKLRRDPPAAAAWIEAGVLLQVNASYLLGDGGPSPREAAMQWIEAGWVSFIATDSHNLASRRPRMNEAIDFISQHFGEEMARRICIENPAMLLPDQTKTSQASSASASQAETPFDRMNNDDLDADVLKP